MTYRIIDEKAIAKELLRKLKTGEIDRINIDTIRKACIQEYAKPGVYTANFGQLVDQVLRYTVELAS